MIEKKDVRLSPKEFDDKISQLKKSELHIHYRGLLSHQLFYKIVLSQLKLGFYPKNNPLNDFDKYTSDYLAKNSHINTFIKTLKQPSHNHRTLQSACANLWNFCSAEDFFSTYAFSAGLANKAEHFFILSDYLSSYLKINNIVYCELIFSIGEYLNFGWNYQQISILLNYTIAQANKAGCSLKIVLDFVRNIPCEVSIKRLEHIAKNNLPGVIAITLGGDEKHYPAKNFADLFSLAREIGLYTTCHAGEFDHYPSIIDAIKILKVQRIGHGIAAINNQYTIDLIKDHNITLEVCPTSNIYTKAFRGDISQHPIKKLIYSEVSVTIGSDDPGFFNTTLSKELAVCYFQLGFNWNQIILLINQGFISRFDHTTNLNL